MTSRIETRNIKRFQYSKMDPLYDFYEYLMDSPIYLS